MDIKIDDFLTKNVDVLITQQNSGGVDWYGVCDAIGLPKTYEVKEAVRSRFKTVKRRDRKEELVPQKRIDWNALIGSSKEREIQAEVSEDEDMTQLEKIMLKLQKKGVNVSINYGGLVTHERNKVEPFHGGNPDNVLVISDIHSPYILDGYLEFCREQQEKFNCGTVVYIGDIVDFHSISYHEKIPEELNPQGEMARAREMLKDWYYTFPTATITLGNHDCYSDDTMVLTNRGFINHQELRPDDLIGTMNNSGYIEFQEYVGYFRRRHKGEMRHFKGVSTDVLVTPNHRMYLRDYKTGEEKYYIASEVPLNEKNNRYSAKVSFINKNEDFSISDDILELLGYIYGDGSLTKNGGFIIYQQKSKAQKIIDCANRLGLGFKLEERERTIDSICGKELINKTNTHCSIRFNKKHTYGVEDIVSLVKSRYELSDFFKDLSTRQFRIFYEALEYCDANKKGSYSQLDGNLEFLEQLEILLISNGYSARICEYRPGNYRIVTNKDRYHIMYGSHKTIEYDGYVRCLTTPNSNLIVKRNGYISVQGNCLPYRQARTAGLLREFIQDPNTLFRAPSTYKFIDEVVLDGVLYTHGSTSNAFKKCILEGMSMVSGHAHTQCGVIYHQNRHGQLRGMQVGVGLDYKQQAFEYAKQSSKNPITACGVVLNKGQLPIVLPFNITDGK